MAEHEYQCPLTDPYDRLLFEQRLNGAPPTVPAVAANPSAADMAGMAGAGCIVDTMGMTGMAATGCCAGRATGVFWTGCIT